MICGDPSHRSNVVPRLYGPTSLFENGAKCIGMPESVMGIPARLPRIGKDGAHSRPEPIKRRDVFNGSQGGHDKRSRRRGPLPDHGQVARGVGTEWEDKVAHDKIEQRAIIGKVAGRANSQNASPLIGKCTEQIGIGIEGHYARVRSAAEEERSDETRSRTMVKHHLGGRAGAKGVAYGRFREGTGKRRNVTFV